MRHGGPGVKRHNHSPYEEMTAWALGGYVERAQGAGCDSQFLMRHGAILLPFEPYRISLSLATRHRFFLSTQIVQR